MAGDRVARGKEILASLGTEVVISPDGTAEIRGDLGKAIVLAGGEQLRKYTSVAGADPFLRGFPTVGVQVRVAA